MWISREGSVRERRLCIRASLCGRLRGDVESVHERGEISPRDKEYPQRVEIPNIPHIEFAV